MVGDTRRALGRAETQTKDPGGREELLRPLAAAPERGALFFDVDGTLAPIVARPRDASVSDGVRDALTRLGASYGMVACVSGRQALDARDTVGVASITYVGNHGAELLSPSDHVPRVPDEVARAGERVRVFADSAFTDDLEQAGVRFEDKQSIAAFHWRGAPDEAAAQAALRGVEAEALRHGLASHWGRKVLEIRPDLQLDKGTAIETLLTAGEIDSALYAGDDLTDLDGFAKLRELRSSGDLDHAVRVGIASEEGPEAIVEEADIVVSSPDEMAELLGLL
jgi:trehalose 6-phosphate phosphatase